MRARSALATGLAAMAWTSLVAAQTPPYAEPAPQPTPYPPPAPLPAPTYPAQQTYPPPQPTYPPPQQTYPPPPQSYPQATQPYPSPAPPPTAPPPAGYGPPPPGPTPYPAPAPAQSKHRSAGEMAYLYGVGVAYGVGTGIWVDALGKIDDPGIAFIPPLAFGAAVPIGVYLWDQADEFDRAVPSTMATGLLLGGVEGIAIGGLQWQLTGNGGPNTWDFRTQTTVTFLAATAGGFGGYAFGEWFQPDPRSLGFIASGAGWGTVAGVLFGSGIVGGDWKDGAAVWGFAAYNAGILATGALSTAYVPSWQTIKYMWLGDLLGTLATTPVYLFYIGSDADPRHGLIANAVGGLAGLGLAAALTANMTDGPGSASWTPPFQLALGTTPHGGPQLTAYGTF